MNTINSIAMAIGLFFYNTIQSHWWKPYMPISRRETALFGIGFLTGGCALLAGHYIWKWVYIRPQIESLQSENVRFKKENQTLQYRIKSYQYYGTK
ncbi:MAG TPA: hypothetical protein VGW78_06020 [Candidatus Babeliales bacterium]|jgi:hypothetical protein|nr:hypothetical protein [Candidatus Babeliales bacterium]